MRASLTTPQVNLVPGTPSRVSVEVINDSTVIDGLSATLDLGPEVLVTVEPDSLPMFPDETGLITLTLVASDIYPCGTHQAEVVLHSSVDPDLQIRLPLVVEVTAVPGVYLEVEPPTRRGRTRQSYSVTADNAGNVPVLLTFGAGDPDHALGVEFTPAELRLEPGYTGTTELEVLARRRWFGGELRHQVSVLGSSDSLEADVATEATFVQNPVIPRGVRTAAVLLAIIALWAVIFTFAIDRTLSKDALTKVAPASFYASDSKAATTTAFSAGAGLTDTQGSAPAGAVPKQGVAIGIGGTINGQVIAANTRAGVGRITVEAIQLDPTQAQPVSSAATDAQGQYSVAGLLPGQYVLEILAQGYQTVWYPSATSQAAALPITVDALSTRKLGQATVVGLPGSITGTVNTGQSPQAPVTVQVQAEQGSPAFTTTVTTDASGNYSIPNLPTPGSYSLALTSPGYAEATDVEQLVGGENHIANSVTLTAGSGTIGGTVTDGTNPLGGVTITANANGQTITSATPTTGQVGVFSIPNLVTPNTYLLTFSKTGYGTVSQAVNLGPGQSYTLPLPVVMPNGAGSISGTVYGPSGALGGATITINGGTKPVTTQSLTAQGSVGIYTVSGLSTPGSYTVTFASPGLASQTVAVNLASNGSQTGVNATLSAFTGTIGGTVTGPMPPSGVTVSLTDGATTSSTTTDSNGKFAFTGLAPKSYTLTFSLAGYCQQTALELLPPGGNLNLSITLPKSTASC